MQGLHSEMADSLRQRRQQLAQQTARLQALHPGRRLQQRAQLLDDLSERLLHASPLRRTAPQRLRLAQFSERLRLTQQRRHERTAATLAHYASQLAAYNPSAVLERGYAIAFNAQGEAVRDANELPVGASFSLRLTKGRVSAISEGSQLDSRLRGNDKTL